MEIYLGKTVIYKPAGGMQYRGMDLVAVVTRVYENERVNLAIFDPTGNLMRNPPMNISVEFLTDVNSEPVCQNLCHPSQPSNTLQIPNLSADTPVGTIPNIPFDKSELPAGARMVEHRPATPEEIEAAKAGIGVSNVKSPKKPVKKPVKKPKSPRRPKSGY